jgi:hypothetical protein
MQLEQKSDDEFLLGIKLKDKARKSLRDTPDYLEAAEHFDRAGTRSLEEAELSDLHPSLKLVAETHGHYCLYEKFYCLGSYHHENQQPALAAKEHQEAFEHLTRAIEKAESGITLVPSEVAAHLNRDIKHYNLYRETVRLAIMFAHARDALQSKDLVRALDYYRRIIEHSEKPIELASSMDPAYERIARANRYGSLANAHQAYAHIYMDKFGQMDDKTNLGTISQDWGDEIFLHLFMAYKAGKEAFRTNPEWLQYADLSEHVHSQIREFLLLNKGAWPEVLKLTKSDPELVNTMKGLDMAHFREIEAKQVERADYRQLPPYLDSSSQSGVGRSNQIQGDNVQNESPTDFQVVLLIHGIRTEADWGPMVRSKIEVPGKIEVIPIKYGYLDAFRFWFPFWTRNRPIERVYTQIRVALQVAHERDPHAKLSIIAHSFGTYIIGQILKQGFDLHIHRLILCGSVLPQNFPWEQYQGRFDREKVINECGKTDIWPVLAQSTSWGYGASGTQGFGAVLVKDRFHAGGHGQYFEPDFVEKSWEPFIRRGKFEGTKYEVQMPPTPWWMSVLGIFPLRWLVIAIIVFVIAWGAQATPWIRDWHKRIITQEINRSTPSPTPVNAPTRPND